MKIAFEIFQSPGLSQLSTARRLSSLDDRHFVRPAERSMINYDVSMILETVAIYMGDARLTGGLGHL